MRRGIVIFLIVLTALSVVGLAAYRITVKLSTSGEAPVISFENDDDAPSGTKAIQTSLFGIIPSVSFTLKW